MNCSQSVMSRSLYVLVLSSRGAIYECHSWLCRLNVSQMVCSMIIQYQIE